MKSQRKSFSFRMFLVSLFLFCLWIKRKIFGPRFVLDTKIPGTKPHWLFGNLPLIGSDRILTWESVAREHGGICYFWLGPAPALIISDVDAIKHVLVENSKNYDISIRSTLRAIVGDSVLTLRGNSWRQSRKMLNPAFTHENLKDMVSAFSDSAEHIVSKWTQAGPKTRIDGRRDMIMCTSDIVCRTLFRMTGDMDGDDKQTLFQDLLKAVYVREPRDAVSGQIAQYVMTMLAATNTTGLELIDLPTAISVSNFVGRMRARLNALLSDPGAGAAETIDLISILLAARTEDGRALSVKQMINEAITFQLAGFDTTANALAWGLYYLAHRPDVMAKMRDEAREVTGIGPIEYTHYTRFVYIKHVASEILRLSSPVPAFDRVAQADDVIGGYHVAAGTPVIIVPYIMHTKAELWPEPHKFDPDRWQAGPASPFAFIPFAVGQRKCMGYNFAMMELVVVLASLARVFCLSWDSECSTPFAIPLETRRPSCISVYAHPWEASST